MRLSTTRQILAVLAVVVSATAAWFALRRDRPAAGPLPRSTEAPPVATASAYSVEAARALIALVGPEATGEGPVVTLRGRALQISAVVEQEEERGDSAIVGMAFRCDVDGHPQPALATGSVGVDRTRPGAIKTAIEEWAGQYGGAIAAALLHPGSSDAGIHQTPIDVGAFVVYPGLTGIRGTAPELNGASPVAHARLLRSLEPSLRESFAGPGLHTITLTLVVHATAVEGECRADGRVSPPLCQLVREFPWPRGNAEYMLKQYYVLAPRG